MVVMRLTGPTSVFYIPDPSLGSFGNLRLLALTPYDASVG